MNIPHLQKSNKHNSNFRKKTKPNKYFQSIFSPVITKKNENNLYYLINYCIQKKNKRNIYKFLTENNYEDMGLRCGRKKARLTRVANDDFVLVVF